MLILITGPFGIGKTTQLLQLYEFTKIHGIATAGVICPAMFERENKTGINALLLPAEKLLRLAKRFPDDGIHRETIWDFDTNTFAVVNQHFETCKAQFLIIDEIGPQELLHKRGFTSALSILDNKSYEHALVVIRPSLLEEAQRRWGAAQVIALSKTQGELEKVVKRLS